MPAYVGPEYERVGAVQAMHNIPRFGHQNQISKLASFEKGEQVDYALGVLFLPSFLFSILIYWVILILTLKCLGEERTGFLSGSNLIDQPQHLDSGLRYEKKPRFLRSSLVRIIFILSGCAILVFCMLLATEGIKNVESTISTIEKTVLQIRDIIDESIAISTSLIRIGNSTRRIRDEVVNNLVGFCPGAGSNNIMKAINTEALVKQLDELNDFIVDGAMDMRETLREIDSVTNDVLFQIDKWTDLGWIPFFPILPYITFSSVFILGTCMSWLNASTISLQFFETWIALPIFSVLTALCWIVACIIGFLAILNGDLCSGGNEMRTGPEMTLQEVLNEQNLDKNGLLFDIIVYFTMGCTFANPFRFIDTYERDLNSAIAQLQMYQAQIDFIGIDTLSQMCEQDVSNLVTVLKPLSLNLVELLQNVGRALSLIACQRVNQLFVNTFHDGICKHSINALTWTFSSLLTIAFCGMIIITLRASWLKTEKYEYEICYDGDDEETAAIISGSTHSLHDDGQDEDISLLSSHGGDSSVDSGSTKSSATNHIVWVREDDYGKDGNSPKFKPQSKSPPRSPMSILKSKSPPSSPKSIPQSKSKSPLSSPKSIPQSKSPLSSPKSIPQSKSPLSSPKPIPQSKSPPSSPKSIPQLEPKSLSDKPKSIPPMKSTSSSSDVESNEDHDSISSNDESQNTFSDDHDAVIDNDLMSIAKEDANCDEDLISESKSQLIAAQDDEASDHSQRKSSGLEDAANRV